MRIIGLWCIALLMSGCLVRTYTVEKPRVDLDMEGNKGYLVGATAEAVSELKQTRPTTVFEVELGSHRPRKRIMRKISPKDTGEEVAAEPYMEEELFQQDFPIEQRESEPGGYTTYTVQDDDTLQKISKKFYGTTKKFLMLYEVNKDVL